MHEPAAHVGMSKPGEGIEISSRYCQRSSNIERLLSMRQTDRTLQERSRGSCQATPTLAGNENNAALLLPLIDLGQGSRGKVATIQGINFRGGITVASMRWIIAVTICGALPGAMSVDAAITGCCEIAESQTPVLGVAVPYAIGNVLLTILGPIIVTFTFTG